jgi:hypothetical protein
MNPIELRQMTLDRRRALVAKARHGMYLDGQVWTLTEDDQPRRYRTLRDFKVAIVNVAKRYGLRTSSLTCNGVLEIMAIWDATPVAPKPRLKWPQRTLQALASA